jgi:isopentenyl-diphosphate Delta-isomerase
MSDIDRRKRDHLSLAATGDVGFRRTTLLECVELVHDALPECNLAEISTSTTLLGRTLRVPLVLAAMTGGTERAAHINRELAAVAESRGCGFGLGSQRAMLSDPSSVATYRVRDRMPTALLLGNIGGVQAASLGTQAVRDLVESVEADALCVHLNPAMELAQFEGDRDFRGVLAAIERLVAELGFPVVVKETGSGLSGRVGRRLRAVGVRHVDVSGAGGTSWVAVEQARHEDDRREQFEGFREWGIPTAATVSHMATVGFETIIATGGIASGVEVAKCLALGASAAGIARPVLQAFERGGAEAVDALLSRIEQELVTAMVLTGTKDVSALRHAERVIYPPLDSWLGLASP